MEANVSEIKSETPDNLELSGKSDKVEQKIWKVVQDVPGLNIGYGTVRLVVYISKGNKEQAWQSAIGIAKGLLQSAAIVGSVFVAPILAPIAAGAFTGIVTESIQGAAHVVIFIFENSGELHNKPLEDKEKLMYNEVKDISAIGALYSTARLPACALKGDTNEAKSCGINVVTGTIDTAISCGLSVVPLNNELKNSVQKIAKSLLLLLSRKEAEVKAVSENVSESAPMNEDSKSCGSIEMEAISIIEVEEKDKVKDDKSSVSSAEENNSDSGIGESEKKSDSVIETEAETQKVKIILEKLSKIIKRENSKKESRDNESESSIKEDSKSPSSMKKFANIFKKKKNDNLPTDEYSETIKSDDEMDKENEKSKSQADFVNDAIIVVVDLEDESSNTESIVEIENSKSSDHEITGPSNKPNKKLFGNIFELFLRSSKTVEVVSKEVVSKEVETELKILEDIESLQIVENSDPIIFVMELPSSESETESVKESVSNSSQLTTENGIIERNVLKNALTSLSKVLRRQKKDKNNETSASCPMLSSADSESTKNIGQDN